MERRGEERDEGGWGAGQQHLLLAEMHVVHDAVLFFFRVYIYQPALDRELILWATPQGSDGHYLNWTTCTLLSVKQDFGVEVVDIADHLEGFEPSAASCSFTVTMSIERQRCGAPPDLYQTGCRSDYRVVPLFWEWRTVHTAVLRG